MPKARPVNNIRYGPGVVKKEKFTATTEDLLKMDKRGPSSKEGPIFFTLQSCCAHRDGVPTFTRQPQILIKDAKSNEPIAVLDIGFQSVFHPTNYLAKDNGKYTCLIKNQSGLIAAEMTLEIEECIKMEPKKTNDAKCEEPEKAADVKKSEKHEEKKADKTGEV
ncbi:unnamed protein product [Toxocara canis]|uniref:Ig-like domain-containing protein n=1 Tax=Toxocara canis TaxID=6265 RepID=A0A183UZN8_TOXCA|nr:unnamed protein product [Toxocara canis]